MNTGSCFWIMDCTCGNQKSSGNSIAFSGSLCSSSTRPPSQTSVPSGELAIHKCSVKTYFFLFPPLVHSTKALIFPLSNVAKSNTPIFPSYPSSLNSKRNASKTIQRQPFAQHHPNNQHLRSRRLRDSYETQDNPQGLLDQF